MRYSPLLIPLVVIGLSGCASDGVPASRQTMTTQTTRVTSTNYLTPEQSSGLIILPGDTTSPAQLRFLSASHMTTQNNWRMVDSGDSAQKETTDVLAGDIPR